MDSTEIQPVGGKFSEWKNFNKDNIEKAPSKQGVYILRKNGGQSFGRLKGKSDLLYIGSTEANNGLKQRLKQYLNPGPTQWTNLRINKLLKKYNVEVSWCLSNEPRNLEHQLLNRYLNEHDELPPFNHAGRKTLKKIISDSLAFSDQVTVNLKKGK